MWGSRAAKTGSSLKDTFFNSADDWGRMDFYSDTGYKKDDKGKLIKPSDEELSKRTSIVNQAMSTPETWADYLNTREKKIKEGIEKSKVDGFSLTKDAGFSRDFLPQLLAMSKGGAVQRWKDRWLMFVALLRQTCCTNAKAKLMIPALVQQSYLRHLMA